MSASWQRNEWFRQAVLLVSAVVFLLAVAFFLIFFGAASVAFGFSRSPSIAWLSLPLLTLLVWLWACWQGWRTRDLWKCPVCRRRLAPGKTNCVWCAAPIKRCLDCGYPLKVPDSTRCPECGRDTG